MAAIGPRGCTRFYSGSHGNFCVFGTRPSVPDTEMVIGHGRNTVVVSAIMAMPISMRMSDSDGGPAVSDRPAETKEVIKDNDVDNKEEVDKRNSSGGYEIRLLNQYSRNTS